MSQDQKFEMRLNSQKRALWEEFMATEGYKKLAPFIRDCVDAVIRNPHVLHPTKVVRESDEILKKLIETSNQSTKELTDVSSVLTHRIDNLEVLLKEIALKQGLTKKQIKKALQKDLSHEWVNDVE